MFDGIPNRLLYLGGAPSTNLLWRYHWTAHPENLHVGSVVAHQEEKLDKDTLHS